MRQTTRKKYYGRTEVAQDIRSALNALTEAIKLLDKPLKNPAAGEIDKALYNFNCAIKACQLYKFGGARIFSTIGKLHKETEQLLKDIQQTPVFMEEKIKAKQERKKVKSKKKVKHGRNDSSHARTDTGSRAKGRKTGTGRTGR